MNKMLHLFIAICFSVAMFSLSPLSSASAQVAEDDTLAIEIHMLYLKLLNRQPDYSALIYSNPEFQSSPKKFGQEAILNQQFRLLQTIYNEAGKSKPIYHSKDLPAVEFSRNARQIHFNAIPMTEPLLFALSETETYGVFIRNGDLLERIAPPYEFDDFTSISNLMAIRKGFIRAQFMLEPIAADTTPFPLESGENVNVVLADLIELKLIDETSGKLLLHKKFNDNNGLPIPVVVPTNRDYMPLPPATP